MSKKFVIGYAISVLLLVGAYATTSTGVVTVTSVQSYSEGAASYVHQRPIETASVNQPMECKIKCIGEPRCYPSCIQLSSNPLTATASMTSAHFASKS